MKMGNKHFICFAFLALSFFLTPLSLPAQEVVVDTSSFNALEFSMQKRYRLRTLFGQHIFAIERGVLRAVPQFRVKLFPRTCRISLYREDVRPFEFRQRWSICVRVPA